MLNYKQMYDIYKYEISRTPMAVWDATTGEEKFFILYGDRRQNMGPPQNTCYTCTICTSSHNTVQNELRISNSVI